MKAPTILWALFGFDGRVGREVFWLGNIMMGLLALVVAQPVANPETGEIALGPLFPFVAIPVLWSEIALAVKRLHDRNLTGWFAVIFAVPFVGIAAFIIIGLIPGDRGPNKFGTATNTRA